MQVVYRGRTAEQAEIVRLALNSAGIHAQVQGAALMGASGEIPVWLMGACQVVVPEEEYERAVRFMAEHQGQPEECPNCGYNLTGLPEPRCPECGEPFKRPERPPDWTCPTCGEQIEGQFTTCWKCGRVQPE